VKDAHDLAVRVAEYTPGTTVALSVLRSGEKKDVQVQLGTLPGSKEQAAAEPAPELKPTGFNEFGLALAPAKGKAGVTVTKVDPDGKAADSGLQEGDMIVAVGKTKVSAPADFEKQVAAARSSGSKAILLQVKSGKQT